MAGTRKARVPMADADCQPKWTPVPYSADSLRHN